LNSKTPVAAQRNPTTCQTKRTGERDWSLNLERNGTQALLLGFYIEAREAIDYVGRRGGYTNR